MLISALSPLNAIQTIRGMRRVQKKTIGSRGDAGLDSDLLTGRLR
jgi:hypothetical protein